MRCPKCGYISFDHLEVCLKCKKNISEASEALQGGVLHVTPPVFLNLQSEEDQSDEYDLVAEAEEPGDEGLTTDFEVFTEEESAEESEEGMILEMGEDEGEESGPADFEMPLAEEQDPGIAIDPSLFDDDVEIEDDIFDNQLDGPAVEGEGDFEIEMPEELADMSDLAPPSPSDNTESPGLDSSNDLNALSIDLDSLEFNLDSDIFEGDESIQSPGEEEEAVSLGDIDFSDTIGGPGSKGGKKSKIVDMDDDLNFDLDLGGLSIHDDK